MNILAIYGSNSGNTKNLMYFIKEYFKKKLKCKFKLLNAKNINFINSFLEYDLVILSTPTWGGLYPTLQDDFATFWNNLDKKIIKENKFAIIGLGNLYYKSFCKAVDFLSDEVIKYRGELIVNSLSIPDDWNDYKHFIAKWGDQIILLLNATND